MEAGTKISFLFASRLQAATTGGSGTNQLAYVLIISVSTSDRNNTGTGGITD
jgi:hypothetical protein